MMGRVSDMAMDQQQEGVDVLLCEIDHWKTRADEAARLLATLAEDEKQYRHNHDHYGPSDLRTGNSWDHMRRAGDKARAFLEAKS